MGETILSITTLVANLSRTLFVINVNLLKFLDIENNFFLVCVSKWSISSQKFRNGTNFEKKMFLFISKNENEMRQSYVKEKICVAKNGLLQVNCNQCSLNRQEVGTLAIAVLKLYCSPMSFKSILKLSQFSKIQYVNPCLNTNASIILKYYLL